MFRSFKLSNSYQCPHFGRVLLLGSLTQALDNTFLTGLKKKIIYLILDKTYFQAVEHRHLTTNSYHSVLILAGTYF